MTTRRAISADHVFARDLFDADWYAKSYPDVGETGLAPAYHYRRYGHPIMSRPPNAEIAKEPARLNALLQQPPAEGSELVTAYNMLLAGKPELALAYAQLHVPAHLAHTVEIIRANGLLATGDVAGWLTGINAYLTHHGTDPLALQEKEGSLIERFSVPGLAAVEGGPLVSVIMSAWNAEKTIAMAVRSILDQTWRNIELIVVDDASSDGTWAVLSRLAAENDRLRIRRNSMNVGPYVSKNLALDIARGEWITGHDADDWAHPRRMEQHLKEVLSQSTPPRASLTFMIRMRPGGHFDTVSAINPFSPDGVTRISSISTLFSRELLREHLGYWDSVRFGADTEMIARARKFLGDEFRELRQIGMICLSTETALTNHPDFGIRVNGGRPAPDRLAYKSAWIASHKALRASELFLPFPQTKRRYQGKFNHAVPLSNLQAVIAENRNDAGS